MSAKSTEVRFVSDVGGGARRIGADLVIEALQQLGIGAIFGVPGVHALANWDAMRRGCTRYVGARTELGAAFAADGYSRATGKPSALALSTGPGALISLAGLMEAATSYVPVIAIASQIDSGLLGRKRGALHELSDQMASFSPVVKWCRRAHSLDSIPYLVAEAWETAVTPPSGPVFLEIPVDVLNRQTDLPLRDLGVSDPRTCSAAVSGDVGAVVDLLEGAREPVIWAGGGVIRAGAWDLVAELAERIDAPVLTTYMGKGAIPENHPLAGGSACDEEPFQRALRSADVVVCIGSELGEEATSSYTLTLDGALVQIDAAPDRIGGSLPALPLIGDAAEILGVLLARLSDRAGTRAAKVRAENLRRELDDAFASQGRDLERGLLCSIRDALPPEAIHCWDMTVLGYWAARDFPARSPRRFLYPVGSGTLGYAWPAAIGASVAEPGRPVLAVAGDGGIMYSLQELASARQAGVGSTLLIVDDGGYGILREYQQSAYGAVHGVDLVRPDFLGVARGFGIDARPTTPATLRDDVAWGIAQSEPTVVVLEAELRPPTTMA